ncbi:MAG: sigma-54 dependent transcriptional regulator [candidate division Zixibacteria bacterium]|nr:sigma-54 dependent transcriptional regulator [candidate division Zixibacteria bacterium]
MASILIVEDEDSLREALAILLRDKGYEVTEAMDGKEGISILKKKRFDLVLTDLKMKEVSGEEVLKKVKEISPETEVIIITAYGTIPSAVEAMKTGAFDYITKPFKVEEMLVILNKAIEKREILKGVRFGTEERKYSMEEIVFVSKVMDNINQLIKKVAPTDITILIEGESGTGKELLARAIHKNSLRDNRPFVTVSSGLPETLLESELFGYVKGAFTGALTDKKGLFEIANSGTIFLDEISDTSPALQMRFLRAIQEKEIRRVGGEEFIKLDVRLITASNRNLSTLVKERKFRDDLYYRINVMPIYLPPLRERIEDIVPLARHFIKKYAESYQKEVEGMDEELKDEFQNYHWPGNIRELEHTIERGVALATSSILDKTSILFLPEDEKHWLPEIESETLNSLKNNEKAQIIKTLKKNKWNYTKSAEELGISRTTLWRRMKEYRLRQEM